MDEIVSLLAADRVVGDNTLVERKCARSRRRRGRGRLQPQAETVHNRSQPLTSAEFAVNPPLIGQTPHERGLSAARACCRSKRVEAGRVVAHARGD